jgi:hypothetical protein
MFCDLVGSTPLAACYDLKDLREVIGAYHRCIATRSPASPVLPGLRGAVQAARSVW